MKRTEKISTNITAVSPVIGVILMVAITVIIAAVMAAYVFGVGGSVNKEYVVGAVISQISPSQIDVTYYGGKDMASVDYIAVNVYTSEGINLPTHYFYGEDNTTAEPDGLADVLPGSTSIFSSNNFTFIDHVTVTATFLDGSQQVIMDRYV